MIRSLGVFAVVFGLFVARAGAAEVLVDDPKALSAALKLAQPGDVVLLRTGEWRDAELRIVAQGTADKPVTVRAQVPGKTVLVGESSIRIGGRFVVVDGVAFRDFARASHLVSFRIKEGEEATDCRLTNVSIDGAGTTVEGDTEGGHWVSLYGARNRVDHCYFRGKRTASPMLTVWVGAEPNDHRIDHNHFAGRPPLGRNGGETMRIGTSDASMNTSRTIVEDNLFTHCDGESEIISNKSCENVYRRNVFVESKGGLVLRHGNRCVIDGNWFFGNGVAGTGGIRVIGEDHRITNNYLSGLAGQRFESAMPFCDGIPNTPLNGYFQVKRVVVAHNTWVDCAQSVTFGVGTGERGRSQPVQDLIFANNLISGSSGPLVTVLNAPVSARWMGNVFWGADLGLEPTDGFTRGDPQFKAPDAAGVRVPGNAELLRTAAVPLDAPVTADIDGRARGEMPTAGAHQADVREAARRPVTADDVGPAWSRGATSPDAR